MWCTSLTSRTSFCWAVFLGSGSDSSDPAQRCNCFLGQLGVGVPPLGDDEYRPVRAAVRNDMVRECLGLRGHPRHRLGRDRDCLALLFRESGTSLPRARGRPHPRLGRVPRAVAFSVSRSSFPRSNGGRVRSGLRGESDLSSVVAFGANLLGAMVGGLLEYGALVVGYRGLLLVVAGLYSLAFLFRPKEATRVPVAEAATGHRPGTDLLDTAAKADPSTAF